MSAEVTSVNGKKVNCNRLCQERPGQGRGHKKPKENYLKTVTAKEKHSYSSCKTNAHINSHQYILDLFDDSNAIANSMLQYA